jgi:uncharacterized protein YecE (DUF72 family)
MRPKNVIRIGTSGYSYYWNEGKPTPFEWYLMQGFPTVEINASFYRFPSTSWAKAWSKAPERFDFSVKVHRSITHYAKLRGNALALWRKFTTPLKEIEDRIAFWLFQMSPAYVYSRENVDALSSFFEATDLGNNAVVEFREPSWWKHVDAVEKLGVVFCSVDAPGLPRDIVAVNDVVYLRLHGRSAWYSHIYADDELKEIMDKVYGARASRKYVYLNNDEGMLENGKYLMELSERLGKVRT